MEPGGDTVDAVFPSDKIAEEEFPAGGDLVTTRTGAAERNKDMDAGSELTAVVGGVLGHEGLASAEALEGVVGDDQVRLVLGAESVGGV